nr:bifunctional coenzyme A synthase-like isoform X1 [Onthophagus taurus]
MIVKTGLLIVSNPKHIGKVLATIKTHVNNTLYIQLLSALQEPFGSFQPNIYTSSPKFSKTINGIYSQVIIDYQIYQFNLNKFKVAYFCEELDVRVLLSGLKYNNLTSINTQRPVDLVIFDKPHQKEDIDAFIKKKINNITSKCGILTIDSGEFEPESVNNESLKIYKHTVLGGTFDRLHIAHKLLLTEAALRTNSKITVGVTDDKMLEGKLLSELVEPLQKRIEVVKDFLMDINGELETNVVPISDPMGPTKNDNTMELLIVSEETMKGGKKVNEVRVSNKLKPLDVFCVKLIDEPHPSKNEETKISSSTSRMRILGTLLKPVENKMIYPKGPYVIGLTGGIASGKSGVSNYLQTLGAMTINCDLLAHSLYKPGELCYQKLIETFGKSILTETGEINRKILGGIVFSNKSELNKLNSILWPAIKAEVIKKIQTSNSRVVVVEAAVLLAAGWTDCCDEIWTTIVPKDEAIKRLQSRNNLSVDEAKSRLDAQMSNRDYVKASHVVFCTLWEVEYTRQQVDKAWGLLMGRMDSAKLREKL